jgi:hypothetical protein
VEKDLELYGQILSFGEKEKNKAKGGKLEIFHIEVGALSRSPRGNVKMIA